MVDVAVTDVVLVVVMVMIVVAWTVTGAADLSQRHVINV